MTGWAAFITVTAGAKLHSSFKLFRCRLQYGPDQRMADTCSRRGLRRQNSDLFASVWLLSIFLPVS